MAICSILLLSLFALGGCATTPEEELARQLADSSLGQIVRVSADEARQPLPEGTQEVAGNTPVVMMHGMGDFAENPMGMVHLKQLIGQWAGAYVNSVALCSKPTQLSGCNNEDQMNGFFMTMDDQVDQLARVVRADPKLAGGFHAVGFSQGNTVIRGYIHRYNNPPVKAFVSLHGIMMGVAGLPRCPMNVTIVGGICKSVDWLLTFGVYTSFVQNRLAQANYFRDAWDLTTYRKDCQFLPYINNEVQGQENATYSSNFASLERLVLVMASSDSMVHPKETEHFGYFKDKTTSELVSMRDGRWYKENWFGLKTLDEAKKIHFHTTPGDHLRFTTAFLQQVVGMYFKPTAQASPIVV